VKRATKETVAGRRYLDLQREARRTGRPTDELIQLYALECFLDRLVHSSFAENFVLKGGVLLAALQARRPTRDIDLAGRAHCCALRPAAGNRWRDSDGPSSF
jgi:nucleotidyltransferase AbiEii toxin of type IV toxin-antitoxin system